MVACGFRYRQEKAKKKFFKESILKYYKLTGDCYLSLTIHVSFTFFHACQCFYIIQLKKS